MKRFKSLKKAAGLLAVFAACGALLPAFADDDSDEGGLQMIRVIPGDTLHAIAKLYLKDPDRWPELLKYNVITSGDPDVIHAGDKLLVPVKEIKKSMRAAFLIEKIEQVSFRARGEALFRDAALNQKIFYEDTLRTFANAHAKVLFPTKEVTRVSPNSLVIIKPRELDQEVTLLRGEVFFKKTKVQTPSAVLTPQKEGLYRAVVADDKSTNIEVFEGKVDVASLDGKGKIELGKGFSSNIKFGDLPMAPAEITLPDAERLKALKDDITLPADFQISVADIATVGVFNPDADNFIQEVTKRDKIRNKISSVEIALDEYFSQIILKLKPLDVQKEISKLADGKYYYRVEYAGGDSARYSKVKGFELNRAAREMSVIILYPPANLKIDDEFIEVRGSASRDISKLSIDTALVDLGDDGSFSQIVYLPLGPHEMEIVFQDRLGNTRKMLRRVVRVKKQPGFWQKIFGGSQN
ncbi:FecR domain-containing protein [bacterium]|nr:FecR domain-containing protein [bacterium]